MGKIHHLSEEIISHIAAGQVIERPASVVKELVENALDAGAHRILIELKKGGLDLISVSDDGYGMSRADVELAFLPHTTSKISDLDDIVGIQSFGFRGEALASMAAMSELTISSRKQNSIRGWKVLVEKGVLKSSEPFGMPPGTSISVEHLFKFSPVRKKTTLSSTKELRECLHVISGFALMNPQVSWEVRHNGKKLYVLSASTSQNERIGFLFGQRYQDGLLELQYEAPHLKIEGYIGSPQIADVSKKHIFSVNNRLIEHAGLSHALKTAYGTLLPALKSPFACLHIRYPHEMIDVNCDPQKKSIRFHNDGEILEHVQKAVLEVLDSAHLIPGLSPQSQKLDSHTHTILHDKARPWHFSSLNQTQIIQIHRCYLVFEENKNMYIVDQHAAHERILYEQFLDVYKQQIDERKITKLDNPILLKLSPVNKVLFEEVRPYLEKIGFEFDKTGIKIHAIPTLFEKRDISQLISEIIEQSSQDGSHITMDSLTHATITYIACRSAIKAGDALSPDDARKLIKKLTLCSHPQTCPHGRPTMVAFSNQKLDHLFHRS